MLCERLLLLVVLVKIIKQNHITRLRFSRGYLICILACFMSGGKQSERALLMIESFINVQSLINQPKTRKDFADATGGKYLS